MKNIAILGSTGSIGTQTLDIVDQNKEDLQVVALAAGSNITLLEKQARKYRPTLVAVWDQACAKELKENLKDTEISVVSGMDGLLAVATHPASEILVTAIVGMLGIRPTIAAIEAGKDIALANKETLVTAGHIIMPLAKKCGVSILPVDSEHSAIFQALAGGKHQEVKRLLITASGGPFRGKSKAELENVTLEQCLKHPNWSMGRKITVDSSTLANKGLEVIEAHWLFDMPYEKIDVVVHPQSVIHSLVEYQDGSVLAQLGLPDMRLPIQYAFSYPERFDNAFGQLDLVKAGQLTFEAPDLEAFPALKLAVECGKAGGTLPCAFNAANEESVYAFLDNKIKYLDIPMTIEKIIVRHQNILQPVIEDIEQTDAETRRLTREILKNL